jgi:hypothetical protein
MHRSNFLSLDRFKHLFSEPTFHGILHPCSHERWVQMKKGFARHFLVSTWRSFLLVDFSLFIRSLGLTSSSVRLGHKTQRTLMKRSRFW